MIPREKCKDAWIDRNTHSDTWTLINFQGKQILLTAMTTARIYEHLRLSQNRVNVAEFNVFNKA